LRVAFDASATRGRKTGIGVYTGALIQALREFVPQIQPITLDDGASVIQRTDRRIWREQVTLPRLAQVCGADLLHLTGFAAPLRARVPVILTVMDLIGVLFPQNFPPVARFYWSRYLPRTLRAARHMITLSEHTRRDVLRLAGVPADAITVIPPGVDARFHAIQDSATLAEVRARQHLPDRYFLFVGTLEPRKGIDTLIEAYRQIAAAGAEHLVIVGKRGWHDAPLRQRVSALGLDRRVHFADYVADEDLPAVYRLATAFVFPSRYEGFGLPPLEAMACGTPVISSNASSLPEVVGGAGILVAPDDVAGYARAMRELAADEPRRRAFAAAGLERAQSLTWQRAARETAAVYARVHAARTGT